MAILEKYFGLIISLFEKNQDLYSKRFLLEFFLELLFF